MLSTKTNEELLNTIKTAYRLDCLPAVKTEVKELVKRHVFCLTLSRKSVSFDPLEIASAVILIIVWLILLLYLIIYRPAAKLVELVRLWQ